MRTATAKSLLDDADFFAKIETLDDGLTEQHCPQPVEPPVGSDCFEARYDLPPFVLTPEGPVPAEKRDGPPTPVARMVAAAMFVLMMGVGAAGAALVFHDRVSRLLDLW